MKCLFFLVNALLWSSYIAAWPTLVAIDMTQSKHHATIDYKKNEEDMRYKVKAGTKGAISLQIHGRWGNPADAIEVFLHHPSDNPSSHTTWYLQLSQEHNDAPMGPTLLDRPNGVVKTEMAEQVEKVELKIVDGQDGMPQPTLIKAK